MEIDKELKYVWDKNSKANKLTNQKTSAEFVILTGYVPTQIKTNSMLPRTLVEKKMHLA